MPLTYDDWLREARGRAYLAGATVRRLERDWPKPTAWQRQQIDLAREQHKIATQALEALRVESDLREQGATSR